MNKVELKISNEYIDYNIAVELMEKRVQEIIEGKSPELIWLLEHPSIYTAGTSAKIHDLINPIFPVYNTGRGGQYTYHGPGQRVAYIILNLKERSLPNKPDIKNYIFMLEQVIIDTLKEFKIQGQRREGRVGIWVSNNNQQEYKIAAIGVKIRKWITFHGIAINVSPNLNNFKGIIPCGIKEFGITSIKELGIDCTFKNFDDLFIKHFVKIFSLKI